MRVEREGMRVRVEGVGKRERERVGEVERDGECDILYHVGLRETD